MQKLVAILPAILLATACASSPDPVSQAPQQPVNEVVSAVPVSEPPASGGAERSAARRPTTIIATTAPDFTFKGSVLTTLTGDVHTTAVELVVSDQAGQPAANVEIHGSFTDGIKESVVLTTNADGIAVATATGAKRHMKVGFAVTGVTYLKDGVRSPGKAIVDIYPSPCCPLKAPPTL